MACDAFTWYKEIGTHTLFGSERQFVQEKVLENKETYLVDQTIHVWISAYCKASMYDLAWEFGNYERAEEKLEVYVVARNANMGGIAADRSRRHEKPAQIRVMYAQKSPFSMLYT
jgi:hypothetical protein